MLRRRIRKRMFAVSCEGIGLIAGTMAYSRKDAIMHFQGGGFLPHEWERSKREGYRTVEARISVLVRSKR